VLPPQNIDQDLVLFSLLHITAEVLDLVEPARNSWMGRKLWKSRFGGRLGGNVWFDVEEPVDSDAEEEDEAWVLPTPDG